ncbi:uncharacterized protein LOC126599925 isoform X3 [Malus sylvestris]|uniref:uncharacterized protein LOC126599925 isoform X3 n=1 Tax=Malus sylvestris TaxID=3752 RepID=UPI0021ABCC58|nr:uncharacterized protein LOC126599925 isoform X3 [Malus sylvestris]
MKEFKLETLSSGFFKFSLQVGEREGSEWEQGTTRNNQAHENVNVQGTRGRVTDQLKKTEQGQIQYSEKYFNDIYEYRHVAKLLPKNGLLCETLGMGLLLQLSWHRTFSRASSLVGTVPLAERLGHRMFNLTSQVNCIGSFH